ncbi:MAG: homoserine dehydrogenase [Peptostreptococcaceae bacterium]
MRIGILGYGTVGSGLVELLDNNKDKRSIEIGSILVRNKDRYEGLKYYDRITTNIEDVFESNIDILVELMGGINPSYEYIKKALNNNINVVTANKDLIAEHGEELIKIAKKNNVSIKFEASVGGGIPVLKPIIESLEGNKIDSIKAILNGTTNFILSKMHDEGISYEEALKQAQELGFAEANPESDVMGYDSARKLSILSTLAYNNRVYWKDLYLEGITNIDEKDIDYAKKLNCKIKLVGQSDYNGDKVCAFVRPVLIDNDNILSRINNEFNAVVVNGDSVGEVSFVGKGAGKLATGSAVYSDILDILDSRNSRVDSFDNGRLEVDKVIKNKCSALIRFESDKRKELLEIIDECSESFDIISEDGELAILVNAKSEYEINNCICVIKDFGYCKNVSKLIKIQ